MRKQQWYVKTRVDELMSQWERIVYIAVDVTSNFVRLENKWQVFFLFSKRLLYKCIVEHARGQNHGHRQYVLRVILLCHCKL